MTIRTPDQRLRVYVSADPLELADERECVRETLLGLRMAPVVPDDAARPHPAEALRRAYLEQSDVFVGVYGRRYGGRDPATGLSALEADYLAASPVPRLLYRRDADGDAEAREPLLDVLLARVAADDGTVVRSFRTPRDLAVALADDLALLLTERFTASVTGAGSDDDATEGPERPARPAPVERSWVPVPAASLIGRDDEVDAVSALVTGGQRLVTLTGPGGIGKTRIALAVAARLREAYADGAWVVDLSAVRDPALLAPTVAHALRIREGAGLTPLDSLKGYLAGRHLLLVLDGFEGVAAAAPLVVDLLAAAPRTAALVTSRSVLRVRGEHEHPVPPLAVPREGSGIAATSGMPETGSGGGPEPPLDAYGAVALFLDRATATAPGWTPAEGELPVVAEIVRRLDGLPLAIELAAARTRVLTPRVLLDRLGRRLDVLTGGARDLPERQRTLRATLDWDHDGLTGSEQVLFRRLGVLVSGFTLSLAEAVVGDLPDLDLLDGVDQLLGKSLLRPLDPTPFGEPRFGMLSIVREYATERLESAGELGGVRAAHAGALLALAERARRQDAGDGAAGGQADWLARLEQQHGDLRAALRWADTEVDVDVLTRLAAALGVFWRVRGHFTEGRQWLGRALALTAGQRTPVRVELLNAAAFLARARGEYDTAGGLYQEAYDIRRELGDDAGVAGSLRFLGNNAFDRGDVEAAEAWWRRSLAALADRPDDPQVLSVHNNLGVAAYLRGDFQAALDHYEATVPGIRKRGDVEGVARLHMNVGLVTSALGDHERAAGLAREAVAGFASLDDTWDLVDALDILAAALGAGGRVEDAGWVYGAAEALRHGIDAARAGSERESYERRRAEVRATDPGAFDRGVARGRTASVRDAVAVALGTGERVSV